MRSRELTFGQERESEQWLGEWMKARDCRDEMVIATKYTTGFRGDLKGKASLDNFQGACCTASAC